MYGSGIGDFCYLDSCFGFPFFNGCQLWARFGLAEFILAGISREIGAPGYENKAVVLSFMAGEMVGAGLATLLGIENEPFSDRVDCWFCHQSRHFGGCQFWEHSKCPSSQKQLNTISMGSRRRC